MKTITTEQLADLWRKPPRRGETAEERRRRMSHAAEWARRQGIEPVGWGGTGQKEWPEDVVMAALARPRRPGNRTSGEGRRGGRRKSPDPA